jgi:EAL domain-containing protein (putative c-di-GMP-specific phosphodiesterase class I)
LIKNVFALAKRYHIAICCEGVEKKSELAVLEQMKPDLLQGYLFDRPLTAPQVELAYMVPDAEEFRRRKNRFSTEKQQNLNIKKGKEF